MHNALSVPGTWSEPQTPPVDDNPSEAQAAGRSRYIANLFTAASNTIAGAGHALTLPFEGVTRHLDSENDARPLLSPLSRPDVRIDMSDKERKITSAAIPTAAPAPDQIFLKCINELREQISQSSKTPPSHWRSVDALDKVQKTLTELDALLSETAGPGSDGDAVRSARVEVLLSKLDGCVDALVKAQPAVYWPKWISWGSVLGTFIWGLLSAIAAEERDEKAADAVMRPLDVIVVTSGMSFLAYQLVRQVLEQYHSEQPKDNFATLRMRLHQVRVASTLRENERFVARTVEGVRFLPFTLPGRKSGNDNDDSLYRPFADGSPELTLLLSVLHNKAKWDRHGRVPFPILQRLVKQMEVVSALPLIGKLDNDGIDARAWDAVGKRLLIALSRQLELDNDSTDCALVPLRSKVNVASALKHRSNDINELADAVRCLDRQVALAKPWERKSTVIARTACFSRIAVLTSLIVSLIQIHRKDVRASALSINALDFAQLVAIGSTGAVALGMETVKTYFETYGAVDPYEELTYALHQWNEWLARDKRSLPPSEPENGSHARGGGAT